MYAGVAGVWGVSHAPQEQEPTLAPEEWGIVRAGDCLNSGAVIRFLYDNINRTT